MGSDGNELTTEVIAEWNSVKADFWKSYGQGNRMPSQDDVVKWLKKIGKFTLAALVGALSAAAFKKLMGW